MNVSGKKHRSAYLKTMRLLMWLLTGITDLQSFREALSVLQRQVEELDELRADYYQDVLQHEEEVWDFVQGKASNQLCFRRKLFRLNLFVVKVSVVIRTTLDVIDRVTTKS